MTKVYICFTSLIVVAFFSACSGNDGSSASFDENTTTGIKVISCSNINSATATNDCGDSDIPNYYTCIQNGDVLEEQEENTIVEIITLPDNSKKVCVKAGSAILTR